MWYRAVALIVGVFFLGACTGIRPQRERGKMMGEAVLIEVLGFGGCPNTPTMQARVVEAVGSLGQEYQVIKVDQESLARGDIRRGYPTPTVLVNGADLFGMPVPSSPAMGCRVYPGGLPSAAEIEHRLSEWANAR